MTTSVKLNKIKLNKIKKEKILTENDLLKFEIAEELGLTDKVRATGWKSLTARESGKIGGIMNRRIKEKQKKMNPFEKRERA
ncbi:MAG: alpha/beta-type small acid-soluble spore protein [Defluviitaleaceae bacterium]|nr:alpha/beta-type small acid-soluble spore protein [Defluviitaleaceae bacterium]